MLAGLGTVAALPAVAAEMPDAMGSQNVVMVGGAPMYPSKNIVQNAVNSKDHTTLVAAVKAAGLVDALEGKGPFTVFAPTNAAFGKLPAGTVDTLVKPENKPALTKILTYHVVPGRLDAYLSGFSRVPAVGPLGVRRSPCAGVHPSTLLR